MEGYVRLVIAALLGTLLTGAGTWVTWGRNIVDEPKVIELIETRSPYVQDRRYLEKTAETIEEVRLEVVEQGKDLAEIKAILKAYIESEKKK